MKTVLLFVIACALCAAPQYAKGEETLRDAVDKYDLDFIRSFTGDINQPLNDNNDTAITRAAAKYGRWLYASNMVKLLIAKGADPNVISKGTGWTPLITVILFGEMDPIDFVNVLIAAGADVNVADKVGGNTALMYAAKKEDILTIKALIDAGADLTAANKDGKTCVDFAGNEDVKKSLLAASAASKKNQPKALAAPNAASFRIYSGLSIDPLGFVVTELNKDGFPGGVMFGGTLYFYEYAIDRYIGLDISYVPLLETNGLFGSASANAIPILVAFKNGDFNSGIGISLGTLSGSLVDSMDTSGGLTFAFSEAFLHDFETPGLFIGVKAYFFISFTPVFEKDAAVGLILGYTF